MFNWHWQDAVSRGSGSCDGHRRRRCSMLGLLMLAGCTEAAGEVSETNLGLQGEASGSSVAPTGNTVDSSSAWQGETLTCPTHPKWQSRGVGGGGALFAPTINPFQGGEVFMSSDLTGIFHTRNYGRSWEMLPFYVMEGSHRSYVRFTSDPNILYALNLPQPPLGPRSIIKSNNGGVTWDAPVVTPGDPTIANNLFVDPGSTRRVLFANTQQLYFSQDGGQSFSLVYTTPHPEGLVLAGAHFAGRNIYVGTSDGMLVSHDGGQSFAAELNGGIPANESIVSFAGASRGRVTRFFAVTFTNQDSEGGRTINADITGLDYALFAHVYRLTLGENSWQLTASELLPVEKLSLVATSEHDANVAYLGGTDRTGENDLSIPLTPIVLKTEDGGLTWKHVFLSRGNINIVTGWSGTHGDVDWFFGEMALGLAVSPSDPNRVVLTDEGFVHVSSDGGRQWRQAYVDPRDENPAGRDTPKSKFYHSVGLEQTSCWWLTWSTPRTLFASFTDIVSVFSRDGGESWTRDSQNGLTDNTTYHVVIQPGTGVLYAATSSRHDLYQSPYLRDSTIDDQTGTVVTSLDRGAHWTLAYDFKHPVIWLALDPNRPNVLYASVVNSSFGGIYRLDLNHLDQPPTLLPAPPRTKGHPYNVYVLRDGSIVASYSGHQDGNTRVFTDRSGVFLLPTGSQTWLDVSAPEMHFWTKDIVVDPQNQNTWYVGVFTHDSRSFGGLYRTTNRGQSWDKIAGNYRVESCAIDPKNPRRMYMTTQGEGLWLTENLNQTEPDFRQVREYPFEQPMRVFWNPFDHHEVWTVSFGTGMRVARE